MGIRKALRYIGVDCVILAIEKNPIRKLVVSRLYSDQGTKKGINVSYVASRPRILSS